MSKDSDTHHQGENLSNVGETSSTYQYLCSPCYIGLKNNVSTKLLETTLNRFPAGTEEYVSHVVLKDYIQNTAIVAGVHESTVYNTEVRNMSKCGKSWIIDTATLYTNESGVTTRMSLSSVCL
jgi:hypothetical protein